MKKIFLSLTCVIVILFSCKRDDYLTGGSRHNTRYNVTTYDFLKNQSSGLFDTLLILVDKAGLKDKLNQPGVTFFAPTDYAITNYLERRAAEVQRIDPLRKWTLDSLI